MSETNDSSARGAGKTLSLKKTETSTVKQSFSHGRTKAVVVEKKRVRVGGPTVAPSAPEKTKPSETKTAATVAAPTVAPSRDAHARAGVVLRQLTDEEKDARSRALADARVAEDEARKRADEEARRHATDEARLARERAAAEKRKAEEDARKIADELARRHAEEEAARRLEKKEESPVKKPEIVVEAPRRRPQIEEDEEASAAKKAGKPVPKAPVVRKTPDARRRGKLTVTKALSDDDERTRSVAAYRRHLQRVNRAGQQQAPAPAGPRDITLPETITVSELANRMARRAVDVIKVLMKNGMMVQINDVIDADTAELVATEYGHTVKRVAESVVLEGLKGSED